MPTKAMEKRVDQERLSKTNIHRIPRDTRASIPPIKQPYMLRDTTEELIVPIARFTWDGVERRKSGSCRRQGGDRRTSVERRQDTRINCNHKRSVKARIRSIIGMRLGVDRRKGEDRRVGERRSTSIRSLVTPEELDALLHL